MASSELEGPLSQLLNRLEDIGGEYQELYDTHVREQLAEAVYRTFVLEKDDTLPERFGLFEDEANEAVREALKAYVDAALPIARELGLDQKAREAAIWNYDISSEEGRYPDDFFGAI